MRAIKCMLFAVALLTIANARAGNWPHWRGPSYNGSSDEKNLPTKWSRTENIAWTAKLPGPSASTPVIWGDKVFVSSTDDDNKALKAICLSRKDGKVLWQHNVGKKTRQDYRSTYSAPSPVTNGELVVFFYGNGEMVTYDMDGKKLWNKNFGPFAFQWTFASSPLLYDGKLYLQVLQRNVKARGRGPAGRNIPSYILALNPKNGEQLLRQVRTSNAKAESLEAFSSPVPIKVNGKTQLVVVGGDAITGHDPATLKELWRWGTWNPKRIGHWRLVPSPVGNDDVILACAPKGSPIYAVKSGLKGTLKDSDLAWISKEERSLSSDVPTPAFAEGDFFVLNGRQAKLLRVEPKTGKVKWNVAVPRGAKYEASPLVADGKVYLINFFGLVTVVSAKDGKILNRIEMQTREEGSNLRSCVIASQGQLFIRTNTTLYCVGKK